ncbi:MAG: hypothetical protein JXR10_12240, partial [Cyclobacteriaceae bacterium]
MKYLFRLLTFIISCLAVSNLTAQTTGLIYKPASGAGSAILDPNQDGYTSKSTSGFGSDDELNSEIPFVPMPVFGSGEPDGDLSQGPSCGFTDLVRSDDNETMYTYSDGTYLYFRFRLGGTAENSKGYSILIDSDQKFGDSDTKVDGNPGFEVEIVLRTNFGVSIYDIDNVNTAEEKGTFSDRPYDIHAQKSIAGSTICGTDYFYDFYVSYADLAVVGITSSTPLRMIGGTVISPKESTGGTVSDIAGIDDDLGITDDLWEDLIEVFPPTSGDDLSGGSKILPKAECPTISSPVEVGATSVTGTSSEVDGAIVELFKNGISQGTALVASGAWTKTISTALVADDRLTANVKVTDAKSVSDSTCNGTTVGAQCSSAPINLSVTGNNSGVNFTISGSASTQYTISLYDESTGALISNGKWAANENPITITTDASGNATGVVDANQGSAVPTGGVYYVTSQSATSCESDKAYICGGSATATPTPTIPATIEVSSSSINVGNTSNGAILTLYINNIASSFSVTSSGTTAAITGISGLAEGDSLKVLANASGNCPTFSAVTVVTADPIILTPPTIEGEYCGNVSTISGLSSHPGASVRLYTSSTSPVTTSSTNGGTVTVAANGSWSFTGLSLTDANYFAVLTEQTGQTSSGLTTTVDISPQTTGTLTITNPGGNTIRRGDASISGTSSIVGATVYLYLDGFIIDDFTAVVDGSGNWQIGNLNAASTTGYDVLYADATIGVTQKSGSNCESDIVTNGTVQCQEPDNSMIFAATSATTVCAGETVSFSISTTENLIVYELVDQNDTGVGPSILGDGTAASITSFGLESSVTTIRLVASRIGVTCDSVVVGSISVSPEQINLTSVITQQPNDCASPNGAITLSGMKPNTGYTLDYKIDGVAVATQSPTSDGSGEILLSGLSPGDYTDITITGTAITLVCGNIIEGPISLVNPSAPTITLGTTVNATTCGGTEGSINIGVPSNNTAYDVSYTKDGSIVNTTITSNTSKTVVIPSLSAGDYSSINITVAGCKSNNLSTVLTEPVATISVSGSSNTTSCGGSDGAINLSFTNVPGGTYSISYEDVSSVTQSINNVSVSGDATSSTATLSSLSSGTYNNLRVTAAGCLTTEDPDVIISDPAPVLSSNGFSNPTTCGGTEGSISFLVSGLPDGTYTFNYVDGSSAAQTFTNVSVSTGSATVSSLSAGVYNDITVTNNGCTSVANIDVTLSDPVKPTITLGTVVNPSTCNGTDGSISLTFTDVSDGTYTLSYVDVASAAQTFTNVVVTSNASTISGLSAGIYNDITITKSNNCTSVENIDVTLSDPAVPSITLGTNPSVFAGTTAANLPYSSISNSPNQYSITYNAAALAEGFVNVSDQTLPVSPITLAIPSGAAAATYAGDLTVRNSTTNCNSGTSSFNVVVIALPELSIVANSANNSEGDAGSTAFTFTVTRSGNTSGTSSVSYTVTGAGGSSASADDFGGSFPSGVVNFAASETSQPITINVSGDTDIEDNEGFTVTLSSPSGATLSTASANGSIKNDEFEINAIGDVMINENVAYTSVTSGINGGFTGSLTYTL